MGGSYSASASATSGNDLGPVTVGGTTFGPQYAAAPSVTSTAVGDIFSSPLMLVLGLAAIVFGFLLWNKAKKKL